MSISLKSMINETVVNEALLPADTKVVKSFFDKKPLEGRNLNTDGKVLKTAGIGSQEMYIHTPRGVKMVGKITGKYAQSLVQFVNKNYKSDLVESVNEDTKKRFDVDFYKGNGDRQTSHEEIIRGDKFSDVVSQATKVAKSKGMNYVEFYHRDSFIGSIDKRNGYQFKKGRNYQKSPLSVNEEKVYIDFLNKKKGFKQDRIRFNSYEAAVKWAKKNFEKFSPDMIHYESVNEGKDDFVARHGKANIILKKGYKHHNDTDLEKLYDKVGKLVKGLKVKDVTLVFESVNEASNKPKFKVGQSVNYLPKLSGLNPKKKLKISRVRYDDGDNLTSKGWYYSFNGMNLSAHEKDIKLAESVNESASRTAMEIGGLTGMNKDAIQKFVDTNELDIEKVFQFVKKGKLSDRMDLVSAIAGKPNNPIQKKMIKMFQESVNEAKFGYKTSTASYINKHKDEYKVAEKMNKGNEMKFYDDLQAMEDKVGHPKTMLFISNALRGYGVDMYKDPKIKNPADAQEALYLLSK